MDINKITNQMTLQEKADLLSGTNFWETNEISRLKIPSIYMTDGPCGLRKQGEDKDHLGLNKSLETTSFPTGASIGASWNPDNMKKMGIAIAEECIQMGVNIILAPAINIKRNPKCGRNFEYLSEDPLISGDMGKEFVNAVQKMGVGTSVKHFAVNNNENNRFMGDSIVDERALREIYLRAFEKVVKESYPTSVMSAYNKVNSEFCSENQYLLKNILREEWKFEGAVISDWGGVSDRINGLNAGLDLEMPGDCKYFRNQIIEGVKSGKISKDTLDDSVRRILKLISQVTKSKNIERVDYAKHHKISEEIACDSAVLLKNESILPLKRDTSYFIVGDLFQTMRYQGAGSSLINPTKLVTPKDAFDTRDINYEYSRGYLESELTVNNHEEKIAIEKSKNYDTILFFGGQTDYIESEGYDRENLLLPENQISLIKKFLKLGKKVVFILYGGSPVELPFISDLKGLLNMYLPGQGGGEATARLLFGEKSPSGKLSETWVKKYENIPFASEYSIKKIEPYKESIFVGYRYFDGRPNEEVLFPFGFGLTYSKFEYTDASLSRVGNKIIATCKIKNIGAMEAAEVVQLYVSAPKTNVFKPLKELRAYKKITLCPGEEKEIVFEVPTQQLSYYNVDVSDWIIENGKYKFLFSSSSTKTEKTLVLELTDQTEVNSPYSSERLPHYYDGKSLIYVENKEFESLLNHKIPIESNLSEFTMDSKISELKNNFLGRVFYSAVVGVGRKQYRKAAKMNEGPEKEMTRKNGMFIMKLMPNNSLRSMAASSAGKFDFIVAQGLLDFFNHNYVSGLKKIFLKSRKD